MEPTGYYGENVKHQSFLEMTNYYLHNHSRNDFHVWQQSRFLLFLSPSHNFILKHNRPQLINIKWESCLE